MPPIFSSTTIPAGVNQKPPHPNDGDQALITILACLFVASLPWCGYYTARGGGNMSRRGPHYKKKINVFRRANNRAQHAYISVRINLTQASQDEQSSWWSERGPKNREIR